ncbi:hypothetical protein BDR04DRAFT_1019863, partial [Suillus decipiens]
RFAHITCRHYYTTELPHEYATHGQWEAALASKLSEADQKGKAILSGPKYKKLNLKTYKYHALRDYPDTI